MVEARKGFYEKANNVNKNNRVLKGLKFTGLGDRSSQKQLNDVIFFQLCVSYPSPFYSSLDVTGSTAFTTTSTEFSLNSALSKYMYMA